MHLQIVIAYALLIWWPRERPFDPLLVSGIGAAVVVLALLGLVAVTARWACVRAMDRLARGASGGNRPCHRHHVHLTLLNGICLLAFVAEVALTGWADSVASVSIIATVPGMTGLVTIGPYLAGLILVFLLNYPVDRVLRDRAAGVAALDGFPPRAVWTLRAYMEFNVRHHVLTVVVPMTLILAGYDVAHIYEGDLERLLGVPWAPDIALGAAAVGVFIMSPWLLRHIWMTHRLPDGALRNELNAFCERIGLKFREILVWESDGMVANAAVMGVAGPLRYVLLSDGLIRALSPRHIEAVFAHESGHIRHKHIQYFLLFAAASMLVSSGAMELAYRWLGTAGPAAETREIATQGVGMVSIIAFWTLGFGFVSRRFERQADLFGARQVAALSDAQCAVPCGVHHGQADGGPARPGLCATGVRVFVEALESVAALNGIPRDEFSWRHGSIAIRTRFLTSLSGDPGRLSRFERNIRGIKAALVIVCAGGTIAGTVYLWPLINKVAARVW